MSGWYRQAEQDMLRKHVRLAVANTPKDTTLVEIGVFQGCTAHILDQERAGRRLYLYDDLSLNGADPSCWPTTENVVDFYAAPTCIPDDSTFAVLHHDADHTEAVVDAHLCVFGLFVVPGGIIALHDYHSAAYPGVERAWWSWPGHKHFSDAGKAGSLQIWVRDAEET